MKSIRQTYTAAITSIFDFADDLRGLSQEALIESLADLFAGIWSGEVPQDDNFKSGISRSKLSQGLQIAGHTEAKAYRAVSTAYQQERKDYDVPEWNSGHFDRTPWGSKQSNKTTTWKSVITALKNAESKLTSVDRRKKMTKEQADEFAALRLKVEGLLAKIGE